MTRFLVYPVDFAPVVHHAALWRRSPRGAAHRMAFCSDACGSSVWAAMCLCRRGWFFLSSPRDRKSPMKHLLATLALASVALASATAHAQTPGDKETREDITRHRAMAAAHEAAAKCLESGKGHDACQKALQAACKNLAIGKYCGMKHSH